MSTPTRPIVVSLTQGSAPSAPAGQVGAAYGPVMLESGAFFLRSLRSEDVTPRFLAWLSDPLMMQGLNLTGLDFDLDQLRAFVARFDNLHNYLVGIFDRSSGLLVGFYTIDVDLRHRIGHLTTGIGEPAYLGKGVLWATIDALIDHFYALRSIEKFSARVLARNYRMLFNFKGNPRFELEARLRQECLAPTGGRLDILVFASFKDSKPAERTS